jgi:hypothetical protein
MDQVKIDQIKIEQTKDQNDKGLSQSVCSGKARLGAQPEVSAGTQQVPIPWTPRTASTGHGVFRVQGHHAHRGQEFLLRVPGSAAPQARSPLRRLCVHAPLRRHRRRPDAKPARKRRQKLDIWLDALHRAQQGEPTDDAILLALTDAQRRFAIPAGLLDELALGTAMDIEEEESSRKPPALQA